MKKMILLTAIMVCALFFTFGSTAHADYYSDRILLKYGMSGNEVKNLQNDLKSLGYFTFHTATGYFGSITKDAVMRYQRDNGLVVDGIVGPMTAREIKVDKVIKTALGYVGVPYAWGGTSPSGFDCSGFTHYTLLKHGIIVRRTSETQYYNAGTWVQKSQLKPGDLVFFTTYKPGPSHVGIYLGNGKFVHASSGAGKVVVSEMSNPYYAQRYIGAKRVI